MRPGISLGCGVALALVSASAMPQDTLHGQLPDTLAHPIQISCERGQGPLGYVLDLSKYLHLTAAQTDSIMQLEGQLARRNRPLGKQWWALREEDEAEGASGRRAEVLFHLQRSYLQALGSLRAILTEEQWALALGPDPRRSEPRIRCLARSPLVIILSGKADDGPPGPEKRP